MGSPPLQFHSLPQVADPKVIPSSSGDLASKDDLIAAIVFHSQSRGIWPDGAKTDSRLGLRLEGRKKSDSVADYWVGARSDGSRFKVACF